MWALIPMKPVSLAKGRLGALLHVTERRLLAIAMLQDVLAKAVDCAAFERVAVVTADPEVARLLRSERVGIIDEHYPRGLSEAVEYGSAHAMSAGARSVAVLSADIPTLCGRELSELIGNETQAVTIATDRHGRGSNALVLTPPDVIRPRYGTDSLRAHRAAAACHGISVRTLRLRGLALDIDEPDDVAEFLTGRTHCRSRILLESWHIADRLRSLRPTYERSANGGLP